MIKYLTLLILLYSSLGFSANQNITLHYSGTVVIPPCTIMTPSLTVDFGDIPSADLANAGSTTAWKYFDVGLANCSNVSNITLTFSGAKNSTGNGYASTGSAKHVYVEVATDFTMINVFPEFVMTVTPNPQQEYSGTFETRIVNDGTGAATAGTVMSAIVISYEFK